MGTLYNSVSPCPVRLTVPKEIGEGGRLRCPFVNELVDVLLNGQGMDQQRTLADKPSQKMNQIFSRLSVRVRNVGRVRTAKRASFWCEDFKWRVMTLEPGILYACMRA